jgi:hypothetical protein
MLKVRGETHWRMSSNIRFLARTSGRFVS